MQHTHQQVCDTHAFQTVREAAPYLQILPSVIAMEAFHLNLLGGGARVHGGAIVVLNELLYSLISFFFLFFVKI